MVESEVRAKLKYHILYMLQIKCQQRFGFVPDDLEIEFKPLRELTAEQQENVKTQIFNRVQAAKASGDLSTLEYRDAINKADLLPIKLDTIEDGLNPEDPEAEDIAAGNNQQELGDPGADSEESRNMEVHLGNKPTHTAASTNKEGKNKAEKPPKNDTEKVAKTDKTDKSKKLSNSPQFDKASYEADGGDGWIDPRRRPLFENPGNVDESLWSKAKEASSKAFGKEKWQFITWWYKKQGGKFT